MPSGEATTPWRRLPVRLRDAITVMLFAIVVTGALVPWLGIAQSWRMTDAFAIAPMPGEGPSRLLVLVDSLQDWPVQNGAVSTVMAMAGVLALIMICGPCSARDVPLGRRRATVMAALVAVVVAVLAPLLRILLVLHAVTSTPDEISAMYREGRGLIDVQSLVGLSAEVLAWGVLLLLGRAWWPRGHTPLADDEDVAADEVSGEGVTERSTGDRDGPAEVAPVEQPHDPNRPDVRPRERVDHARLRPDGSSESGFDEFRFRR